MPDCSSQCAVRVRVPASTSNLGPGFDCLGLAVELHNEITVAWGESSTDAFPDAFLLEAADIFWKKSHCAARPFSCTIAGGVPRSRGLGSSVTVRLGLLHGLNTLCDSPLTAQEIFALCTILEGHPDNAAASAFGGFTICRPDGVFARYEVSEEIRLVLLIPEMEFSTNEARKAVPEAFSRGDAVWNLGHATYLAAALASRNYASLADAFSDRWHQPYRGRFLPFLEPALRAGREAGALGGWLSGSGSTVACLVLEAEASAAAVAHAMQAACHIPSTTRVVRADNHGAVVISQNAPMA